MENVLLSLMRDVTLRKGIVWLNVLNVEKKSVLLRKLGRWLDDQIKVERKQRLQLDFLSIVENLSELP